MTISSTRSFPLPQDGYYCSVEITVNRAPTEVNECGTTHYEYREHTRLHAEIRVNCRGGGMEWYYQERLTLAQANDFFEALRNRDASMRVTFGEFRLIWTQVTNRGEPRPYHIGMSTGVAYGEDVSPPMVVEEPVYDTMPSLHDFIHRNRSQDVGETPEQAEEEQTQVERLTFGGLGI